MGFGDFLVFGVGVFIGGLIDIGVFVWNVIENCKQFEKFMCNKYQWEVVDFRVVGLNFILLVGNFAGGFPGGGVI